MTIESAKDQDRVFDSENYPCDDEFRKAFNDYFTNLPDSRDKPFDCPYLKMLRESVGIIFSNRPSWIYKPQDLICARGAKFDLSRRCRFGAMNSKGRGIRYRNCKLEFYCPISKIEIYAEVTETKNH